MHNMREISATAIFVAALLLLTGCPEKANVTQPPTEDLLQETTSDHISINEPPTLVNYQDAQPGKMQFVDATRETGIDFVHTDGGGKRQYIVQTVVSGLALLDYDGDGWIDIYLLNGAEVPDVKLPQRPTNGLYRNNGDWTFTDVTEVAGVDDDGYGLGATAADYDHDGDQDLYVNNFGNNVFYRNNGDGTFDEIAAEASVGCDACGAGVSFCDVDGDGNLDLYVANYVAFSYENYVSRTVGKFEFAAAPNDYDAEADLLFRSNGDGTFTDVSKEAGVTATVLPSMGVTSLDYDDDGDVDIMVCCDNSPNLLWNNDGTGTFEEVGLLSGVAHDLTGSDNGSMGVASGDYDNDGRLDLFVTNYQGEMSVLYRNVGDGFFSDVSHVAGGGSSSFPHVKWGTTFADFDNDGDRDLFIACGHFIQNIRHLDARTDVRVPNFVLENQGDSKFADVSRTSGNGLAIVQSSRGAAFNDLDNDGDVDVVILNASGPPSILRNETKTKRRGLSLLLQASQSNRDGVGARVTVTTSSGKQVAEARSGHGYQSHDGARMHFGLGDAEKVERIEVRWVGGKTDTIDDVPNNSQLLIYEGGECATLSQ